MGSLVTAPAAAGNGASSSLGDAIAGNGDVSQLFTTLLVAQIRNQNPLEPTDPSQFVAQLTQLSQVETMHSMASQTTRNGALLESLQTLGLGGQVGSTVTAATDRVQLGDTPVAGSFELAASSPRTTLVLTAADGSERRVELGTRSAGAIAFTLDRSALGLPAGRYALRVEAENSSAAALSVRGTLAGVRLAADGSVVVDVDTIGTTQPDTITAFHGRGSAAQP